MKKIILAAFLTTVAPVAGAQTVANQAATGPWQADECVSQHLPTRVLWAGISEHPDQNLALIERASLIASDAKGQRSQFKCSPAVWRNLDSLIYRNSQARQETADAGRTRLYLKDFCLAMSAPCLQQ